MEQGFLIPVYRHGRTGCPIAEYLASMGLPVILVDDGNDEETKTLLAECAAKTRGVVLVRLEKNTGKGGAFIKGLEKAKELGLTHVLQIDADGQHDLGRVKFFLEQSAAHPDMIICGYPEFDETAPRSRVTGRKISNFWAAVVTLSTELKDVLCGFRVYPVDATLRVIGNPFLDKRMGFDTEILVRLYWRNVFPVFFPIKVNYPVGGISNFHVVRDNICISGVFTRLCVGMLFRLPLLIVNRIKRGKTSMEASVPEHWSQQREQAAGYWQLKFLLVLFRLLPVFFLRVLAFPVGFFYFLFSKRGRTESKRYLQKIAPLVSEPKTAKKCHSRFGPLRHIVSFSLALIEKLQSWGGKFPLKDISFHDDDVKELIRELENGKGVFLIFSHLGNTEMLRGLLNLGRTGVSRKIPVTAIMDVNVNAHFSRMLRELNPQSGMDIIGAGEVNLHTAILLEEKLAAGGMVVIAGDRTSADKDSKNFMLPFLGKEAPFSSGVFYMAALMNAPVFFVFGLRRKTFALKPQYNLHVHKSPLSFDCTRKERFIRSELLARSFAEFLESYCKEQPFQWYNFFDFWHEGARA